MFSKLFKSSKDENSKKKDKEITLVVENAHQQEPYVVKVAKSSLMKHSAVFKKMAEKGELKKSKQIKLKGITAGGLQKIIEYIKSESVYFQDHFEAIEALKVAYIYQVQEMNDICSNFLITAINTSNVCDIYEFASSYSFHLVEFHCLKFIDRHTEDVLNSPSFLKLKKPAVVDIIKRQSLDVPTEMVVFKAALTWGFNDCLRRAVDAEKFENALTSVKDLLQQVRFAALSEEEMSDPQVRKFCNALNSEDLASKRRSLLNLEKKTRSNTLDSLSMQPREYVQNYFYGMEMVRCDEHAVRNGETFCLRIEALKSRIFLIGVTLAFDRFIISKNNACLYVALSATNVQSTEQVTARGAFMISSDEQAVKFPQPLVVKESESVEIALNVKRAVNICTMMTKSDTHISVSERKDVAMKISLPSASGEIERSMFRGIKYFY